MIIKCESCENEIKKCPNCEEETIARNSLKSIIALVVSLILLGYAYSRWQTALDKYDNAMRLRKKYLRENPELQKPVIFREND